MTQEIMQEHLDHISSQSEEYADYIKTVMESNDQFDLWSFRIGCGIVTRVIEEKDKEVAHKKVEDLLRYMKQLEELVDLELLDDNVKNDKLFWTQDDLNLVLLGKTKEQVVASAMDLNTKSNDNLLNFNYDHMLVHGKQTPLQDVSFIESLASIPSQWRLIYQLLVLMDAQHRVVAELSPSAKNVIKSFFI